MQKYLKIVQQLSQHFDGLDFVQIPRAKNAEADFLARLASIDDYNTSFELCKEIRGQPSIEGEQVIKIKEQDEWMTPIVRYLKEEWLPEDKTDQGRYKSEQPISSLLTMCCTDEVIHSHT